MSNSTNTEKNLPTTNKTEAAAPALAGGMDPYERVAQQAAQGDTFLKFNKGRYIAGTGDDETEIPLGTRMIPNMPEFQVGRLRWWNAEKTAEVMCRVADNLQPPARDELGDLDESRWERDDKGIPRDPWAETQTVPMYDLDGGVQYTFTTGSKGGFSALGRLCREYARGRGDRPGQLPLIKLAADSYLHKVRSYGRVDVPDFEFLGWVNEGGELVGTDDTEPAKPAAVDLDDDIPF